MMMLFRHSLLSILIITVSLKTSFIWINYVPDYHEYIFDFWTYILPEDIFHLSK